LKSRLRTELRARLAGLTREQRVRDSASLCTLITGQAAWRGAGTVLLFAALPDEPDIAPLISAALSAGQRVALPRFVTARAGYEPHEIRDPARDLTPGRFGVLEPRDGCTPLEPRGPVLTLVPGIGFSVDGVRLGRGQGFYDRLLATIPGDKCGVAFECQVGVELPREPHDVRMDFIATPGRWIEVSGTPDLK
jgi:5-formyltetrahydrofolate cyclo-ligase